MEKNTSGVYAIRNTHNGKAYVGSAVCLRRRLWQHKSALRTGKHPNVKLQRAWNKYGGDAFAFEVLEFVGDLTALVPVEQRWLDDLHAVTQGYNVAPRAGSSLGRRASEATKAKLSSQRKGRRLSEEARARRKGRVVPPDVGAKISAALKGKTKGVPWSDARRAAHKYRPKVHTPETIEKLREARTGKKMSDAARGKMRAHIAENPRVFSAETRAKISAALVGRECSTETRAKISEAKRKRGSDEHANLR